MATAELVPPAPVKQDVRLTLTHDEAVVLHALIGSVSVATFRGLCVDEPEALLIVNGEGGNGPLGRMYYALHEVL